MKKRYASAYKTVLLCIVAVLCAGAIALSAQGPGKVTLNGLDGRFGSVEFDHEMHAMMSPDCGQCHHQHDTNKALECLGCHNVKKEQMKKAAEGQFMPCRFCHGEADADTPGMPGLRTAYHTKCFGCHGSMGGVGESPKACAENCHRGGSKI